MSGKRRSGEQSGREKRLAAGEDLLWGINPVFEALQEEPERIAELIVQKDKRGSRWDELIAQARSSGVKLSFVSSLRIEGGGQIRHQGIAAKMNTAAVMPFDQLLEKFKALVEQGHWPRLMVCDSLQDPHNLGAIIRSAHASGVQGVVITRENSAPLGGTAAKSAAGALSHMDISQVTNLVTALEKLKEVGAWIFGAVKESGAQSVYKTDFRLPACVVIGSEGKGIRPLVRKHCDVLVAIPMQGRLDSLNSSVAAGVILFEAMRQNMQ